MKLDFIRWYESLIVYISTKNRGGDNCHVDFYHGIKMSYWVQFWLYALLFVVLFCFHLLICGMCGIVNWNVSIPLTSEMLSIWRELQDNACMMWTNSFPSAHSALVKIRTFFYNCYYLLYRQKLIKKSKKIKKCF